MTNYNQVPYWKQEKDKVIEDKYNLATYDLDNALKAEGGAGEITSIAAWLDTYLEARGDTERLGHRKAVAEIHAAIKESSPYSNFPELKPHEYGDMLRETTAHVANVGSAFWNGEMIDYTPKLLAEKELAA